MISAKSSSETQEQISNFLKGLEKPLDAEKESKSSYQLDVGKHDMNLLDTSLRFWQA